MTPPTNYIENCRNSHHRWSVLGWFIYVLPFLGDDNFDVDVGVVDSDDRRRRRLLVRTGE